MNIKSKIKEEWFGNIRKDVLAGMVVAIALIPEAIGFSILAGVDPMVGLYASFCIAIIIAFFGGRIGMISAATGAMALVLVSLVSDHGIEYMFAATILAGILQIIMGFLKIGKLLRFIPKPVMTGFVNALAILIFMAQLTYFKDQGIIMYLLVALGIGIIVFFPKITKAIPAPLVAIVVITAIVTFSKPDVVLIGDMGNIVGKLPRFAFPIELFKFNVIFDTLKIIFPYALSLAIVGLVESMLTARLLDEYTDTKSDKNKESKGQGIANIVSGCFGGMAGCAMIGQSVINYKSGGRGRLSTLVSGVFLMLLIVILNEWVIKIPIAALVAVMIIVSVATFDWKSLKRIKKVPITDTITMLSVIVVVLITHNLAYGVIAGILVSAIFFANRMSKVNVKKIVTDHRIIYSCTGHLFFASTTHFIEQFDFEETDKLIVLDLRDVKFLDESASDAFDKIVNKFKQKNTDVRVNGLSEACERLLEKASIEYSILPEYVD